MLQRFPEGAGGPSFFQKRVGDKVPDWLETTIVSTPNGTTSRALVLADMAHVLWAVNIACLGFHVWPSRAADPEHADELRIDLDPQPGTSWPDIQAAAAAVRELLDELGVVGYPKTTGNRGLHVYVRLLPRWGSIDVRRAVVALARELERRHGDRITAAWWKEERGERVFVDFNQNAPAQDDLRGLVGTGKARRPGVDSPDVGRGPGGAPRRPHRGHRPGASSSGEATRGPGPTRTSSPSSRCWPSGTVIGPPVCSTRRGRPCTRSSRTSRPGSRPAGPRSRRGRPRPEVRTSRAPGPGCPPGSRRGPRRSTAASSPQRCSAPDRSWGSRWRRRPGPAPGTSP